jgi:transposase
VAGKHNGAVAQIKVATDAKFVHCSIHREAVAPRRMRAILKSVLTAAVKVVNVIKSRAKNSILFSILYNEMGSEHDKFLHTEVRWLSRGNVLSRLLNFFQKCKFFSLTPLQT